MFTETLEVDSGRGANAKAHGTKQVVRCKTRSNVRRAEAKRKADAMQTVNCARIDRSTSQRDRRRAKRKLKIT